MLKPLHPLLETRASLHHTGTDLHCVQPFSHAVGHHLDVAITINCQESYFEKAVE